MGEAFSRRHEFLGSRAKKLHHYLPPPLPLVGDACYTRFRFFRHKNVADACRTMIRPFFARPVRSVLWVRRRPEKAAARSAAKNVATGPEFGIGNSGEGREKRGEGNGSKKSRRWPSCFSPLSPLLSPLLHKTPPRPAPCGGAPGRQWRRSQRCPAPRPMLRPVFGR
jgi:hypothetical protein